MRPLKKRAPPNLAKPVVHKGIRYEAVMTTESAWGSDPLPQAGAAFLVAMDVKSGAELWRAKLYDILYDLEMERDKQEVYVVRLSLNVMRTRLKAVDELDRRYVIDLATHAVQMT